MPGGKGGARGWAGRSDGVKRAQYTLGDTQSQALAKTRKLRQAHPPVLLVCLLIYLPLPSSSYDVHLQTAPKYTQMTPEIHTRAYVHTS